MRTALFLFGTMLIGTLPVVGDEPKSAPAPAAADPKHAADEKAIREADEAFVRAYNAGDVKAIAALFAEDAEAVDETGATIRGRDAIAALFAAIFQGSPGAKIKVETESIRFPAGDVALETGHTTVTPAEGGRPEHSRFTVLFVKRDGHWLQSHVQEQPEKQLSPHDRLKELEWMIGEWVDEGSDAVVFTTCRWSDDKSYLLRDISTHVRGQRALTGTQRIGWDPLTKQIKCWVFESEGGHGEGLWSRHGNQWIVKMTGVLPDGRKSSATQIIAPLGDHRIVWKSVDRTIGGRAIADVGEVIMVKKPPRPR